MIASAPSPLETVTLRDPASGTLVLVAPKRGGMVTRFFVDGQNERPGVRPRGGAQNEIPVLFLDEATLTDETKNVRGGNPVLFPSPGPLTGDRFTRLGRSGSMKQHGFARQRPWSVAAASEHEVTLTLASDDVTRAAFPWDFALTFRYALAGARLRIEQRYENRSDAPMPFAAGFHPYFFVPDVDKAKTSIPTPATRAFDNVTKKLVDVRGPIDLTKPEVDLHLVDHGSSRATLALADGHAIAISGSDAFRRWVVWTLAGRDFVCLEPWTAAADALNTGESLLVVPPDAAHDLWVEIAFT